MWSLVSYFTWSFLWVWGKEAGGYVRLRLTCDVVVVKNPLSPVEHTGGDGVANELFELALDQFVKGVL